MELFELLSAILLAKTPRAVVRNASNYLRYRFLLFIAKQLNFM